MRFDPGTRSLYTDDGVLIKVLRCPLQKRWEELRAADGVHRSCDACERMVLDTSALSDAEVLASVRADPATCLSVHASQPNVTVLRIRNRREADPPLTPPSAARTA